MASAQRLRKSGNSRRYTASESLAARKKRRRISATARNGNPIAAGRRGEVIVSGIHADDVADAARLRPAVQALRVAMRFAPRTSRWCAPAARR